MVSIVTIDLRKAFDTVNHEILLDKLTFYDMSGIPGERFSSCLSSRKQQAYVNDTPSDPLRVETGVPQGSVLGPLYSSFFI